MSPATLQREGGGARSYPRQVVWGFGDAVLVSLVGDVGYAIAAAVAGELDLAEAARRLGPRR